MIRLHPRIAGLLLVAILVGCANKRTPAYNPNMGPFDEDGNYIEAWADNPPPRSKRSKSKPAPPGPEPRLASAPATIPSPQPQTYRTAPKPVYKPKPKPKPKFVRHSVKKGETLYGLARRYGTSVSAIQKANGISGALIRIGQSLKIPK